MRRIKPSQGDDPDKVPSVLTALSFQMHHLLPRLMRGNMRVQIGIFFVTQVCLVALFDNVCLEDHQAQGLRERHDKLPRVLWLSRSSLQTLDQRPPPDPRLRKEWVN